MRLWYRARQFWQALAANPGAGSPLELGPGLAGLFQRMPPGDRAHGLRTLRLLEAEQPPPDLAVAALLHDVGKCRPEIHLWDRVFFVLAGRQAASWLAGLAQRPGAGRWAGLIALQTHAERGAAMVAAAGGAPLLVELIRCHHAAPAALPWPADRRRLLEALQRADERA